MPRYRPLPSQQPTQSPKAAQSQQPEHFDVAFCHPLPAPLNRRSYREVAEDTGLPVSTCHRILTDPTKLTRLQIARLMGVYNLPFASLFELVRRVPQPGAGAAGVRTVYGNVPRSYSADTTPDDDNDSPYQPARHRNGRPVVPLALDEQRTPPPNLDPNELYEPQTPADKRAGRPPVKRKMTEEEFCSYDPEPKDEKSEAYHWWYFRLRTRPSLDLAPDSWAPKRASAEFGNHNPRNGASVIERAEEILDALKHEPPLPIPPFDLHDPRWGIEPTEPKRRGKGKKNKDKNKEQ